MWVLASPWGILSTITVIAIISILITDIIIIVVVIAIFIDIIVVVVVALAIGRAIIIAALQDHHVGSYCPHHLGVFLTSGFRSPLGILSTIIV